MNSFSQFRHGMNKKQNTFFRCFFGGEIHTEKMRTKIDQPEKKKKERKNEDKNLLGLRHNTTTNRALSCLASPCVSLSL